MSVFITVDLFTLIPKYVRAKAKILYKATLWNHPHM